MILSNLKSFIKMLSKNISKKFLDYYTVTTLTIVLIEFVFSFLFVNFDEILPQYKSLIPNEIKAELSVTFLIAGILSLTFEPITRGAVNEEITNSIKELKRVSTDKILAGILGGERTYSEIKKHIMNQPLIRRNFIVHLHLEPGKGERSGFLEKRVETSHVIENRSNLIQNYQLVVNEEIENEDLFSNNTKVTKVSIYPESLSSGTENLNLEIRKNVFSTKILKDFPKLEKEQQKEKVENLIKDFCNNPNGILELFSNDLLCITTETSNILHNYKRLTFTTLVKPNIPLKIKTEFEAISKHFNSWPFTMSKASDSLAIRVIHPDDLNVECELLHPVETERYEPLFSKDEKPSYKYWKINAAVLPYQGFLLRWRKKTDPSLKDFTDFVKICYRDLGPSDVELEMLEYLRQKYAISQEVANQIIANYTFKSDRSDKQKTIDEYRLVYRAFYGNDRKIDTQEEDLLLKLQAQLELTDEQVKVIQSEVQQEFGDQGSCKSISTVPDTLSQTCNQ